jgi:3-mercaptopyruvate sulfurtransferase SseA
MRQKHRRNQAPFVLVIAGVLLIAGAVVIGILQSRSGAPAASSELPGSGSVQISTGDIPRVNLAEAKSAYDSQEAVFVDVRSAESYQQEHIPGALSIPVSEVEARLSELDREAWIITYCT